jgi:hypothetical protein
VLAALPHQIVERLSHEGLSGSAAGRSSPNVALLEGL